MKRKIFSSLLAIILVLSMLVSCGGNSVSEGTEDLGNNDPSGDNGENSNLIDYDNPEVDKYVSALAEENNFNGKTFVWCGNENQAPKDEEETGDVRNDALYFRQRQLEDEFGITWSNYWPTHVQGSVNQPVVDAVMMDVNGKIGAFDLCYGTNVSVVQPLFIQNMLSDMSYYETVDLEREWWAPGIGETYMINGALYFLTGPIFTSYYEDAACIVFNKEVAENYNIENLYDLVYEGKWTFDKMIEIANTIPSNENGSGTYRYANPDGVATLYAQGQKLVHFDEEGLPYVESQLPEALYNIADRFSAIYGDDTITVNLKRGSDGRLEEMNDKYGYEKMDDMFEDGSILFYFLNTCDAAWLRQRDVEFGILPMPKGSEAQEDYISYTIMNSNVFVPKSVSDVKKTDVILEAMAALGYKYIKPTYYDKILKTRATYDTDSKDMIDIICSTKVYEIIDFIAVGGDNNHESTFIMTIKDAIQTDSGTFASSYRQEAKVVNRNINKLVKVIDKDTQ